MRKWHASVIGLTRFPIRILGNGHPESAIRIESHGRLYRLVYRATCTWPLDWTASQVTSQLSLPGPDQRAVPATSFATRPTTTCDFQIESV